MLRSIAVAAVAALTVCVALPVSVMAEDAPKAEKPAKANEAPKVPSLHGTVESVDVENNKVSVISKKETKVIAVTGQTAISTVAKAKGATLADLTKGMTVRVQYNEANGKITATKIAEQAPKAPKPPAEKKEKPSN
jgi:Cu/Ag efflux protein CusF